MTFVGSCLSLSNCAHTTPVTSDRKTIAYEGNSQNAGIIRFLSDGSLEITPSKLQEYNETIDLFGEKTTPKTKRNFGITTLENGNYSITKEAVERWYAMNLIKENERIDAADKLLNL